jgi:hypothetical protein
MRQEDLLFNHTRRPPRRPKPGERLFEFQRGPDGIVCERRDHGPYGVEAQFLENGQLWYSRSFAGGLDPTRTPRELAIQWAAELEAVEVGVSPMHRGAWHPAPEVGRPAGPRARD